MANHLEQFVTEGLELKGSLCTLALSKDWALTIESGSGFDWMNFFLVFLGALVGALAAFFLALVGGWQKEFNYNYRSGLRAQFALQSQHEALNALILYTVKFRDDESRHLNLPVLEIPPEYIKLNFDSLLFVLENKDKNLLGDLLIAQEDFLTVLDILIDRNRNLENNEYERKKRESILQKNTDNLYSQIDYALKKNNEIFDRFKYFLKNYISKEERFKRLFCRKELLERLP